MRNFMRLVGWTFGLRGMGRWVSVLGYAAANFALTACGSRAHDEVIAKQYHLAATDINEQMSVSYALPDGALIGRIPATVFAVGHDERFIVAKQHPGNDATIVQCYYIEIEKDGPYVDPSDCVVGPMALEEFERKRRELKLPDFTRVIRSLE